MAVDCKAPRKITFEGIVDVLPEAAWEEMEDALEDDDLDDFKIVSHINKPFKATAMPFPCNE
jgi:hypothetical protein